MLKFEKITPKFAVSFNNLLKVTEALFSARRKTVSNNLKQLGLTNEQIQELLVKVNILSNYHIEQLTTNDIVNIAINI